MGRPRQEHRLTMDDIQLTAAEHRELDHLEQIYRLTTKVELLEDVKTAANRLRGLLEDRLDIHPAGTQYIREALQNLREALKIAENPNG